jgi:hypothetical protein
MSIFIDLGPEGLVRADCICGVGVVTRIGGESFYSIYLVTGKTIEIDAAHYDRSALISVLASIGASIR